MSLIQAVENEGLGASVLPADQIALRDEIEKNKQKGIAATALEAALIEVANMVSGGYPDGEVVPFCAAMLREKHMPSDSSSMGPARAVPYPPFVAYFWDEKLTVIREGKDGDAIWGSKSYRAKFDQDEIAGGVSEDVASAATMPDKYGCGQTFGQVIADLQGDSAQPLDGLATKLYDATVAAGVDAKDVLWARVGALVNSVTAPGQLKLLLTEKDLLEKALAKRKIRYRGAGKQSLIVQESLVVDFNVLGGFLGMYDYTGPIESERPPFKSLNHATAVATHGNMQHGWELRAEQLPEKYKSLIGVGGKIRWYKISQKAMVCLVKEADGWQTVGIQITDDKFDPAAMRNRSLKKALQQIEDEREIEEICAEVKDEVLGETA